MKKLVTLFLALFLSLSLAAPAALCAEAEEPLPPIQNGDIIPATPETPEELPLQPMNDDDGPGLDHTGF